MNELIDENRLETLHDFSDGTYVRTINVKADTLIVGHYHITDHTCILISGEMLIQVNNIVKKIKAPCIFEAKANTIKIGLAITDVVFSNVFPNQDNNRNVDEIEARYIDKKQTQIKLKQMSYNKILEYKGD